MNKNLENQEFQRDNMSLEVCWKRLGISRSTLLRLIEQRKLAHMRIGGRILIPETAYQDFIQRMMVQAAE